MRSYQGGDSSAFEILYRRHSSRVYGSLMSKLQDRARVDDVQATFLKLHKSRLQYDPTFPFVPWLFTISQSVLVDSVRKSKTIREESNDELIHRQAAVTSSAFAIETDLLQGSQRKAVELRYSEALSFEEIARQLETT